MSKDSSVSDIPLRYDTPRVIYDFSICKLIWENRDYAPQQNSQIPPGNVAFFNPCSNTRVNLEYGPVGGDPSTIIPFIP